MLTGLRVPMTKTSARATTPMTWMDIEIPLAATVGPPAPPAGARADRLQFL
jgi:hypothetical protein